MRSFLKTIFYLLFFLTLSAFPLDWYISSVLKNSNEYYGEIEVYNDIYNKNINCDIAIYGSSRAWVHINPEIIYDSTGLKAYNFGVDGHNFQLQYLRHLEYLKNNTKPKAIIMSVDLFSFQKQEDLYNMNQFLPYMLWNENIYKYTHSYKGYNTLDYYTPMMRYYGKTDVLKEVFLLHFKDKKNYRFNGFKGNEREWTSELKMAKKQNKEYAIDFDESVINLFNDFIVECDKTGIELILVYAPEYIEGQSFTSNRDDFFDIILSLSKKHKLPFLDYSKSEISYDKSLFYNSSHLNAKGADVFTKLLINDIKNRSDIPFDK